MIRSERRFPVGWRINLEARAVALALCAALPGPGANGITG